MAQEAAQVSRRCVEANETRCLDLSACGLAKVPDAIFVLCKEVKEEVHTVDFTGNALALVGKKLAEFPNLRVLRVARNPLKTLSDGLAALQNIQVLDLSHCGLAAVPPVVFRMTPLEHLSLRHNALTNVEHEPFRALTNLRELDLTGNEQLAVPAILELGRMPFRLRLSEDAS